MSCPVVIVVSCPVVVVVSCPVVVVVSCPVVVFMSCPVVFVVPCSVVVVVSCPVLVVPPIPLVTELRVRSLTTSGFHRQIDQLLVELSLIGRKFLFIRRSSFKIAANGSVILDSSATGSPLLLRGYALPSDDSTDADPVSGMVCLLWVILLDSA
jgi:hypothetical protein